MILPDILSTYSNNVNEGDIFQFDHINSIIGNIYVPGTVALSTAYAKHTTVGNPLNIK